MFRMDSEFVAVNWVHGYFVLDLFLDWFYTSLSLLNYGVSKLINSGITKLAKLWNYRIPKFPNYQTYKFLN